MKFLIVSTLLLSTLLLAKIENMAPAFSDFDENRDGKITQVEFETAQKIRMQTKSKEGREMRNIDSAATFAEVDTNKDETIDTVEFSNYQKEHRKQMRKEREKNSNNGK